MQLRPHRVRLDAYFHVPFAAALTRFIFEWDNYFEYEVGIFASMNNKISLSRASENT